ncbi:hypothetical protein ACFQ88_09125 [Paenibacillus sp. NPDC056579]|uniref:hypothetical protein n=1 Tax=Paenibacillus sp. NPDC056579 TaxID=3345871 RepID=UPI00367825C8
MINKVKKALAVVINNWNAMSASGSDDAEGTANEFEASFYEFIDVVREWADTLDERPRTVEEMMELPLIQEVLDLLPAPLVLNFETEAELIADKITRIDDAKYD